MTIRRDEDNTADLERDYRRQSIEVNGECNLLDEDQGIGRASRHGKVQQSNGHGSVSNINLPDENMKQRGHWRG